MRRTSLFTALLFFSLLANGQYWTPLAPYPVAVSGAYGFNINGRLFVGGGISSYDPLIGHSGFYEYLPDSDQWVARATPPFGALYRAGADQWSGHVVGGSHMDTAFHPTNEHWLYDAVNDAWSQKASLPGPGREGLTTAKGYPGGWLDYYAGLGGEPGMTDWYFYWSSLDQWVTEADLPGPGRAGALNFFLNYIGGGMPSTSDTAIIVLADAFEYDGFSWSPPWLPTVLEARPRAFAACFSYDNGDDGLQLVFGGLGLNAGAPAVLDDAVATRGHSWLPPVQLGLLPFGPLAEAVALYQPFTDDFEQLYLGTGTTSLIPGTWKPASFSNTWWRYTAGGLGLGIEEQVPNNVTWSWQDGQVVLHWPATTDRVEVDVLDVLGRIVQPTRRYDGWSMQATIEMNTPGAYLVRWRSGDKQEVIRFVKP